MVGLVGGDGFPCFAAMKIFAALSILEVARRMQMSSARSGDMLAALALEVVEGCLPMVKGARRVDFGGFRPRSWLGP
jgi:hypothetical protein